MKPHRAELTKTRPVCGHCGAVYGRRHYVSEIVRWPTGESPPPYRGNGIVLKESTPAKRYTEGPRVGVGVSPFGMAALVPTGEMQMQREIWDGASWRGGYKPFCTLPCALSYARKAYYK